MLLLTEKHIDDSYFTNSEKEVEFLQGNKMVCLIERKQAKFHYSSFFQIGYLVLHHSEISPKIFKDSDKDFHFFKENVSKMLGNFGEFYSMTPKKNKDFYVVGIKIATKAKKKKIEDCIKSVNLLETIFKNGYGR